MKRNRSEVGREKKSISVVDDDKANCTDIIADTGFLTHNSNGHIFERATSNQATVLLF